MYLHTDKYTLGYLWRRHRCPDLLEPFGLWGYRSCHARDGIRYVYEAVIIGTPHAAHPAVCGPRGVLPSGLVTPLLGFGTPPVEALRVLARIVDLAFSS